MSIVSKVWSNGEFTLGFTPTESQANTMGLSDALNSVSPSEPRKVATRSSQNKFTSNAKRLIRNACSLLGNHKQTSFLTLTLPPLSQDESRLISENAATLIDRFNRWLTRRLVAAGLPAEIVTVREFQKRGALHWHLAFIGCNRPGNWAVTKNEVKAQWSACLRNLLGRNIDCSAATRIERVRKDVGRYLSKYMSKSNAESEAQADPTTGELIPQVPVSGRSWNVSNSLRRRIKIIRSEELGLIIWNHRGELPFLWLREFEYEGKVMGLVGQLPWKGDRCRDELRAWQDKRMSVYAQSY